MSDLPPIERIRSLHVEPGDALVVSFPPSCRIDMADIQLWRQVFKEALGDVPVIFTSGEEIELTVVKS
jgi:hypothetical protein